MESSEKPGQEGLVEPKKIIKTYGAVDEDNPHGPTTYSVIEEYILDNETETAKK